MRDNDKTAWEAVAKFESIGLKYHAARKWKSEYSNPSRYAQLKAVCNEKGGHKKVKNAFGVLIQLFFLFVFSIVKRNILF